MSKNSNMNKGLDIKTINIGNDTYATIIFDNYGIIVSRPDYKGIYSEVCSRDNNHIFEIYDNDKVRYDHYKYDPSNKTLDLINSIDEEMVNIYREKEDTFLQFEDKRDRTVKQELYSIRKGKFITPKVDYIERFNDEEDMCYIFEDIDYKKDIDRENHIYGLLNVDGDYLGFIYDYSTDTKHEIDIYSEPFFMKYYTLKMQLDKDFNNKIKEETGRQYTIK